MDTTKSRKRKARDDEELDVNDLKVKLQVFYSNLVKVEVNQAETSAKTWYYGISRSKVLADFVGNQNAVKIDTLGDSGIFENGIPFYHYRRQMLTEEERKRLADAEMRINSRNFSSAEDRQIRRNWKEFCKLTGLCNVNDASDILATVGADRIQNHPLVDHPFFYPWMCRGLMDRSCVQVFRRAYLLYHPSNDAEGGYGRPWTPAELHRLARLVQKHGQAWEAIGIRLKRPRFQCFRRYEIYSQECGFDDEKATEILAYRLLSKQLHRDPVLAAITHSGSTRMSNFRWKDVVQATGWSTEKCREWYENMIRHVREKAEETDSTSPHILRKALPPHLRQLSKSHTSKFREHQVPRATVVSALKHFIAAEEDALAAKRGHNSLIKESESLVGLTDTERKRMPSIITTLLHYIDINGFVDAIPGEHRNVLTELRMARYILRKTSALYFGAEYAADFAIEFIEKQGWEPRKRQFICHRLHEAQKGPVEAQEN